MDKLARDILHTWFGSGQTDAERLQQQAIWWKKDPTFDGQLRDGYEVLVQRAAAGELNPWEEEAEGSLALVILLDQFSRNIYRDTPRAFAQDALARSVTKNGISNGSDKALSLIQRVFFYMPLMHSEAWHDQERSLALFSDLHANAPEELKATLAGNEKFARSHADIIKRFGRYPHRNQILGRESSAEELAFLQTPGSSF